MQKTNTKKEIFENKGNFQDFVIIKDNESTTTLRNELDSTNFFPIKVCLKTPCRKM